MRLAELKWNFHKDSEKFKQYIGTLKNINIDEIDFNYLETTDTDPSRFMGLSHFDKKRSNKPVVLVKQDKEENDAEYIVSHEIEHLELARKGYGIGIKPKDIYELNVGMPINPNIDRVKFNNFQKGYEKTLKNVCFQVNSTFTDVVIDEKLEELGYNINKYREQYTDTRFLKISVFDPSYLKKTFNLVPNEKYLLSMEMYYEELWLDSSNWNRLHLLYQEKVPDSYKTNGIVKSHISGLNFKNPVEYSLIINKLVNLLDLAGQVEIVNDILTN